MKRLAKCKTCRSVIQPNWEYTLKKCNNRWTVLIVDLSKKTQYHYACATREALVRNNKRYSTEEFKRGVKFAAEIADTYNSSTTHKFMLGDCIMLKLNMLSRKKVRRNKNRIRVFE